MEKSIRIILGFLSTMPLVYFIYVVVFGFLPQSSIVFYAYPPVFVVWVFSLLIFYFVDLYQTKLVEGKAMWVFLLLVGSIVTMPVYWYLFIWSRKEKKHMRKGIKHIFDY
ncbi:MAG: hypothetical protein U9M95_02835 [Candidatus Altiarchaeota archaeon]|nr:hypothetical protein [Candidatus Altiarchaeota archaeon]